MASQDSKNNGASPPRTDLSDYSQHLARLGRLHATNWSAEIAQIQTRQMQLFFQACAAPGRFFSMPTHGLDSLVAEWGDYLIDAGQRWTLTLDALIARGDICRKHAEQGLPPVLNYEYEIIRDGRDLPRPVNYMLARIVPPASACIDRDKRPFLIIDPRAGHGAGIGGFKPESQVGEAFAGGHAVYIAIFRQLPEKGQSLADIRDAEEEFLNQIAARHPNAPKPAVIGNCQGGWASMMLAATAPEKIGPLSINGAPLSYWAGVSGKNPMRYVGGLTGGLASAMLLSDMGAGLFDGALLVQNFENLNPANTYWSKYYNLYSRVDTEAQRFLDFERWWGGFFMMNEEEIVWIVDNLFIGNKLAQGETRLGGRRVSLRDIKTPIILFASRGDNITPPQQALHWIVDLYRDVDDIKASGQRIVYMIHDTIGHLGIFVSAQIAGREHEAIAGAMDGVEALPPGLYEMTLENGADRLHVKFAPRDLEDILRLDEAHSHKTGAELARLGKARLDKAHRDEEMFAAVALMSSMGATLYELMVRPLMRACINQPQAKAFFASRPLRLERELLSSQNPYLGWVSEAAAYARAHRGKVAPHNGFARLEREASAQIEACLNLFRDIRDGAQEIAFHAIYGAPTMRALGAKEVTRRVEAAYNDATSKLSQIAKVAWAAAKTPEGGEAEAIIRMLHLLALADGFERRSHLERELRLFAAEQPFKSMKKSDLSRLISEQALIVERVGAPAKSALPRLLKTHDSRMRALAFVQCVQGPPDTMSPQAVALLHEFETMLGLNSDQISAQAAIVAA